MERQEPVRAEERTKGPHRRAICSSTTGRTRRMVSPSCSPCATRTAVRPGRLSRTSRFATTSFATSQPASTSWDATTITPASRRVGSPSRTTCSRTSAGQWGNGRLFQLLDGTIGVTIEHNTASQTGGIVFGGDNAAHTGFVFRNNVVPHNEHGITGSNTGPGQPTLERYFPDAVVTGNVIAGAASAQYPRGNHFPASVAAFRTDAGGASGRRHRGRRARTGRPCAVQERVG